jgi:hypothetical protein
MAASRFVEVTDKEISEIKINSVPKILNQLFASGSVIIGEYSPRLRLGECSPIITSPSANNCYLSTFSLSKFPDMMSLCEFLVQKKLICNSANDIVSGNFDSEKVDQYGIFYYTDILISSSSDPNITHTKSHIWG